MSKNIEVLRNEAEQLSDNQHAQVVCRKPSLNRRMRSCWGLTFRPGNFHTSFEGNLFATLGTGMLLAQYQFESEDPRRDNIRQIGLAAQIDVQTGVISYERVRVDHNLGKVARADGKGTVLNSMADAARGNASLVVTGLMMDQRREDAIESNFKLPIVPDLPRFYYAFPGTNIGMHMSDVLKATAASKLRDDTWTDLGSDLHDLRDNLLAVQLEHFDKLPGEEQHQLLRQAWFEAFIAPGECGNTTPWHFLPCELYDNPQAAIRVYEGYHELVGTYVYNPAHEVSQGVDVDNPDDVLRAMRRGLDSRIAECCTREALLEAFANPDAQLFAEHMAKIQTLYCDGRVDPEVRFPDCEPQHHGRDNVVVKFWSQLPRNFGIEAAKRTSTRTYIPQPVENVEVTSDETAIQV